MELDLERIYHYRFDGISPATKAAVWRRIASWVLRDAVRCRHGQFVRSILDPACGDGEFLNACAGRGLVLSGCDLLARSPQLSAEVQFQQGAFQQAIFEQDHDLIWISNLLDHLPSPEAVQDFLAGCKSALSPHGVITIMGPNIKYCAADYWDFADHLLPLSSHHFRASGFCRARCGGSSRPLPALLLPVSFAHPSSERCADVAAVALLLLVRLLTQQGVPSAVAVPIAVLRRLITLWSMVALAAAVGVLPLPAGAQLRRNS